MKTMKALFFFIFCLSAPAWASDVLREPVTQFPRCLKTADHNIIFKWSNRSFDRKVEAIYVDEDCSSYKDFLSDPDVHWSPIAKFYSHIPQDIIVELKEIEQKAQELRPEFLATDYLKAHPIEKYTTEVNRELSAKYGQLFSAQVFKAWIESKKENKDLREAVLSDLKTMAQAPVAPYAHQADKIKIVVSFGLAWEEKYTKTTPYYIKEFLADIKSLGLPVLFLKKNPFGKVSDNVEKIIPSLQDELMSGHDLVLISLCKGTPELLAAEAEVMKSSNPNKEKFGKILGHVNLSGMLSGAIFSDFAREIVLPKIAAPFMKLIPSDEMRDTAKMVGALDYMKTSVIEKTLATATPDLDKNIYYVNITGAPMSTYVLQGNSPMKMVLKYSVMKEFVNTANDGFLEMPSTMIPESISKNQATIVLDSSHLLADGLLDEYPINVEKNRRILYYSVLKNILEKNQIK